MSLGDAAVLLIGLVLAIKRLLSATKTFGAIHCLVPQGYKRHKSSKYEDPFTIYKIQNKMAPKKFGLPFLLSGMKFSMKVLVLLPNI